MALSGGARLGPYEILAPLGAGGMGEVYKARDTRLDRTVALKVLPDHLAQDPQALARFAQEARALASLSHPNILSIHDFSTDGATAYTVAELLEGETLRERLRGGRPIALAKAIEYSLQVSQGLVAAHGKGVIHRDLKPENVFVTQEGLVKILDFGLAKVRDARPSPTPPVPEAADGAGATPPGEGLPDLATATREGIVLGTVGYMSPEQAQGQAVDSRSDIFSFGCVVYEMVTGARAFRGDSDIDTLHRIVYREPAPLAEQGGDFPLELDRLVRKCLAKDPGDRYQSSQDVVVDLRDLARTTASGPRASPGAAPEAGRRRASHLWGGLALAIATGLALAYAVARRGSPTESETLAPIAVSRLTDKGNVIDATLSPDGKWVAYVVLDSGQQSLWMKQQLATAGTLQLVPPAPVHFWGLSFTPDGASIVYVVKPTPAHGGELFQIPFLGGAPRKLLSGIDGAVAFSPDGQRIAYVRLQQQAGESALMVARANGEDARALAVRRLPEFFAPLFFTGPSWSPDGTTIVCPMGTGQTPGRNVAGRLVAVRVSDGKLEPFGSDDWRDIGQVAWLPDGEGLLFTAATRASPGSRQVWLLDPRGERRRQLTGDLFESHAISVTSDSKAALTIALDGSCSIWTVPLAPGGEGRSISGSKYDGYRGLSWTPDGRLLYAMLQEGKPDIWLMDDTGGNRRPLTTEGDSLWPVATPDGRAFTFVSSRDGALSLWRAELDGSGRRLLAQSASDTYPAVSPDGRWVVFASAAGGVETLWRVAADGGRAERILETVATGPAVSPDGQRIACIRGGSPGARHQLAVLPFDGGAPSFTIEDGFSPGFPAPTTIRWTIDGNALLHNAGPKRSNVWLQPLSGGPPVAVTSFPDQQIFTFALSPDGKRLALARGTLTRDAVLIRDFH